jgi:putative membrane protein
MSVVTRHWSYDPVLLSAVLAIALEGLGYRNLRIRRSKVSGNRTGRRRSQAWLFVAGVLTTVIAVASPIDYWSDYYFWVHMIQHILLMLVAPFLIVVSAPWTTMYWALPVTWRRPLGRALFRSRPGQLARGAGRVLIRPAVAISIFTVTMTVWFLPSAFDLAYRNQTVHVYGEHLSMFVSGMLLFLSVLGTHYPAWPRASFRGQLAGVVIPGAVMWLTAMSLGIFSKGNLYPVYAHLPGVTLSPFASQQIGASELWVCGDFSLAPTMMLIVQRFLDHENTRSGGDLFAAVFPSLAHR